MVTGRGKLLLFFFRDFAHEIHGESNVVTEVLNVLEL